jgi:hypothetical protein
MTAGMRPSSFEKSMSFLLAKTGREKQKTPPRGGVGSNPVRETT